MFTVFLICATLAWTGATNDDWTQWRGPKLTGEVEAQPPLEWSDTQNVRWKVELPGAGQSTPIVLGDKIFLLTAVDTGKAPEGAGEEKPKGAAALVNPRGRGPQGPTTVHQFIVLCLSRKDGSVIWQKAVREEVPHEGKHQTASFASNSPITDGENLYVSFGSRGLYCLSVDGEVLWEKDLGDMKIAFQFGEGSSPALHGDSLVVNWDHEGSSFIACFDKKTGDEKWRKARDESTSWGTPLITEVNGKPQVIVTGGGFSRGYDLASGEEIWRCSGMTANPIPSPVRVGDLVYLMSGFRGSALQAIKIAEAQGDISDKPAKVWEHDKRTSYVPSALVAGDYIYFLSVMNGILTCLDRKTGEVAYDSQRIEGISNIYASPVGAAGRVYLTGREGTTVVIAQGPEYKVLATNEIPETVDASLAIVDGEILLRGDKHLYCIGNTGSGGN
ncbi:MAG: PQQ-binding-like beta-propeller repeat protein [Planctomycetota bacterium]